VINVFGNTVGLVGDPTFIITANVTLTGVSATGVVSTLNIWSPVKDDQTANWREIAA